MIKTANLTAKDLFNASSSSMSLEKATDLTVTGVATDTVIDAETGEISIHALVKRATANLYNDYLYFGTKYHISDIFPQ